MVQCLTLHLLLFSHPATVPGEPQNVVAVPVNSSSVEVSWSPPVDKDKNGVIRGYQIYVQPKNVSPFLPHFEGCLFVSKFWYLQKIGQYHKKINFLLFSWQTMLYYAQVMRFSTSSEVTKYNVTGLQPDSRYIIQVAAITRKGDGTRSAQVKVKTPGGVPSRPNIDLK